MIYSYKMVLLKFKCFNVLKGFYLEPSQINTLLGFYIEPLRWDKLKKP